MSKTVAFVVNNPSYFVSHRLPIGLQLLEQGYKVHLIAPGVCPPGLRDQGFVYHKTKMSRKGKNLLTELQTLVGLYRLFKQISPDIVHLVTIKPYLYGGIAARMASVPAVVSAVAGLGTLFVEESFNYRALRTVLYPLYHFAFGHRNQIIIFQNNDDRKLLTNWLGFKECKAVLIRGSGVALEQYPYVPEPEVEAPVVALASRLLKDKGVVEFVEASRILQGRGIKASFWLVGSTDLGNVNTISDDNLNTWQNKGLIKYLGYCHDIAQLFTQVNIVVLPSYREGLPKVLIEAAAAGRAVITTNVAGCREAIIPNETGLLVPMQDSHALANAIEQLVANPALRREMGGAGRQLAIESFAIETVIEKHMDIYKKLIDEAHSSKHI